MIAFDVVSAEHAAVVLSAKMMDKPVVHCDLEIMSGTPVFLGTRVPAQTLFDYLSTGQPLSEFLEDFPTVSKEQAVAALIASA